MTPSRCLLCLALATAACNGAASDDDAPQGPGDGTSSIDSLSHSHDKAYTKTKYPIVLAHGLFGFKQLLGTLDYFYEIPDELQSSGAQVFVTAVSATNSTEVRGEQLLKQIEQIVAQTGAGKVNLIGHSQGGMDARYVMGVRPDLLASVTSVGSPHQGAEFADFVLANTTPGGFSEKLVATFGNSIAKLEDLLAGTQNPQDFIAALRTLSAPGATALNKKYPAGLPATRCGATATSNGPIALYSWGGTATTTHVLDISDPVLALTSVVYTEENDGLVGRCSTYFGKVLRDDYHMNHLDEVNQAFGLVSPFETSPVAVFRTHANRLKIAKL